MDRSFPATRAAGMARLAAFTPGMSHNYAAGRNTDYGPEADTATAALSPYLRRRLVLEQEQGHSVLPMWLDLSTPA